MELKEKKRLEEIAKLKSEMEQQICNEPDISDLEPTAKQLNTFHIDLPKREYIFHSMEAFNTTEGFLPSGVTCTIGAPGGCGKTYLLLQAAIAAAGGLSWLNAKALMPIEVLFLAAEEDQEEITRRAQDVMRSMDLHKTPDILAIVEKNLRLFGRLDFDERLIGEDNEPTAYFHKLKFFLNKNPKIKLVILDPASDYMNSETENNNAIAKRWTRFLRQLTRAGGKPCLLVAHHLRKDSDEDKIYRVSEKDISPELSKHSFRGAGGIIDGFRWALAMARRRYDDDSEKVFMRVVKTNYTKSSNVLTFEPDEINGGILKFKGMVKNHKIGLTLSARETHEIQPIERKLIRNNLVETNGEANEW